MSREQLLAFLTRVVRDGRITERQAAELLLAFDEGRLDPSDLPEEQEDEDLILVLPWVVAILVLLLRRLGYPVNPRRLTIPSAARGALQEALRIDFKVRSRTLAAVLARTGDISAWQKGMAELIRRNMIENAVVGAGRILTASELSALTPLVQEQLAFLARFADDIVLAELIGKPMSEGAIAARAELYGRMGLALDSFFEEFSKDYGPGWVVEYIAVDDGGTCGPCHNAQDLYLPTEGPMPGEICYGGMRCRCTREVRYDPVAYARLTGEPVVTRTAARVVKAA